MQRGDSETWACFKLRAQTGAYLGPYRLGRLNKGGRGDGDGARGDGEPGMHDPV